MHFLTDWTEEAQFTVTAQNRLKLIGNGFEYTLHRVGTDMTHWICSKKRRNKCKALAKTRQSQFGQKQLVKFCGEHNHQSDFVAIEP